MDTKEEGKETDPQKGENEYGFLFANNKVQFDNLVQSSQVNNTTATLALQQAVTFQQKANDNYLENADAREKQRLSQELSEHNQRLEHENEIETTRQENMRYTLNYLYAVEGAESLGAMALAQSIVAMMKEQGFEITKKG
ncbi:MAG: hypothetical protein IMF19_11565 [Proteobacteria bacterium]|nr:hypothetical protein [Pseudomonadota bacterium]